MYCSACAKRPAAHLFVFSVATLNDSCGHFLLLPEGTSLQGENRSVGESFTGGEMFVRKERVLKLKRERAQGQQELSALGVSLTFVAIWNCGLLNHL